MSVQYPLIAQWHSVMEPIAATVLALQGLLGTTLKGELFPLTLLHGYEPKIRAKLVDCGHVVVLHSRICF